MHTFNGFIFGCLVFHSNLIAKSKSYSGIAPIGIGPQVLPPLGVGGFVKLRHVADDKPSTSTKESQQTQPDKQQQQQEGEEGEEADTTEVST